MYLQKAGTIILLTSIILYISNTFPVKKDFSMDYESAKTGQTEEIAAALDNAQMAEAMEYTISGRVGKFLEPAFKMIGFDWKVTTATIGALAAKEIFVAQMGILYSEGNNADSTSETLRSKLIKNYTPLQAFCIMLFCLLSIPCLATLAIIKKELNSWKMALAEAVILFLLAYITTFIVYQSGLLLQIGTEMLG